MRFGRGVANDRISFRRHGCHDSIFGCRHTGFIHQELCSAEIVCLKGESAVVFHIDAQRAQRKDVSIESTATNDIPPGRRKLKLTDSRCERASNQNRCADAAAKIRIQVCEPQIARGHAPGCSVQFFDLYPQAFKQFTHDVRVLYLRDVVQNNRFIREQ